MSKDGGDAKRKILLVDDEAAILRILRIKMGVSGYDVVIAHDGEEALALIEAASPDIMLLDILMPGLDGFCVLKQLRGRSDLPVIVFSARAEHAKQALDLGADDYLTKPFDVDDLVRRIDRVLDDRR